MCISYDRTSTGPGVAAKETLCMIDSSVEAVQVMNGLGTRNRSVELADCPLRSGGNGDILAMIFSRDHLGMLGIDRCVKGSIAGRDAGMHSR